MWDPKSTCGGYITLTKVYAAAATIAVRYLSIRRQFSKSPGSEETPVISYPSVYMRIVPAVAKVFVFMLEGLEMGRSYEELSQMLKSGDVGHLAE